MARAKSVANFRILLVSVAQTLNKLGIEYAVTGGYAVSVWGRPRSTLDIDALVRLAGREVVDFVAAFQKRFPDFYVDGEMIEQAVARGGEFNIIDPSSGVKFDFWLAGSDAWSRQQLKRRVVKKIGGVSVHFLSPEDLILSKLIWFGKSRSSRHLEDIESVLAISGERLDREYLVRWAKRLNVEKLWRQVDKTQISKSRRQGSSLYSWSVVSEQGARPSMEDRHIILDKLAAKGWLYGGVYDGHGGEEASEKARKLLHEKFLRAYERRHDAGAAFRTAYQETSHEITKSNVGTCALDFLLRKDGTLVWANAGDPRLIVVSKKSVRQLTHDHRISNVRERARIVKAGGMIEDPYVVKGTYGLMPTRSLGDRYFRDAGVTDIPETGTYRLKKTDQWIIAGTDGFFDVLKNEEIVIIARSSSAADEAAAALTRKVLVERQGRDNLTIIIIKCSFSHHE